MDAGNLSQNTIWKTFNLIALRYDKVNRLMTLGLDRRWRRALAQWLPQSESLKIIDCASGTCDQIIAVLEMTPHRQIWGTDLAEDMLSIGRKKLDSYPFGDKVVLQKANALALPFPDGFFDCAMMSFGIRNIEDPVACLKELYRVVKPGGCVLILECSTPSNGWIKAGHRFYMRWIMPWIGGIVSGNRAAYHYLNTTSAAFPSGIDFGVLVHKAGFRVFESRPLTGGVVSLYRAEK